MTLHKLTGDMEWIWGFAANPPRVQYPNKHLFFWVWHMYNIYFAAERTNLQMFCQLLPYILWDGQEKPAKHIWWMAGKTYGFRNFSWLMKLSASLK